MILDSSDMLRRYTGALRVHPAVTWLTVYRRRSVAQIDPKKIDDFSSEILHILMFLNTQSGLNSNSKLN